jgi:hypothetical protein
LRGTERLRQDPELMVPEANLEKSEHGLVPKGRGWFVLNMRDAVWLTPTGVVPYR